MLQIHILAVVAVLLVAACLVAPEVAGLGQVASALQELQAMLELHVLPVAAFPVVAACLVAPEVAG